MATGSCIWCLSDSTDTDVEHIFPEALGCPDHLTLPGSIVCKRCNNGLAHLDQVVADDFDFLLVMHGARRKRNRPAEVSSRGNVYATVTSDGPNLFFNLDPVEHIAPNGRRLAPFRGRARDLRPSILMKGNSTASIELDVPIGQDKKFARGLYKIALSSIAHMLGPEVARREQFDWIRAYVRHGGQRRRIMITASPDQRFAVAAYPPWRNEQGEYAIEIRIALASFILDLSRTECLLPTLEQHAEGRFGDAGYSILPSVA